MRQHPHSRGWFGFAVLVAVAFVVLLLLPTGARAAPPANDNRASAEPIPAFPATIPGSTVEAIFDEGLHEFLTRYIAEAATLANAINESYLSGEMR